MKIVLTLDEALQIIANALAEQNRVENKGVMMRVRINQDCIEKSTIEIEQ